MLLRVAKGGDMKFKIGDRVKRIGYDDWGVGTIVYIDNDDEPYLVEFNKDFYGHNGDGHGKSDHCWWCKKNDIKLVESKNVDKLIFRDNVTILIKDGKRYVAKCREGDTYDKEKGLLVCLAKANGISFNDLQEMLAGAEYQGKNPNEVKEVKRWAEIGEYVKVIKEPSALHDEYKKGDILKIVKRNDTYIGNGKAYYRDELCKYINADEYVVLENYKPKGANNGN